MDGSLSNLAAIALLCGMACLVMVDCGREIRRLVSARNVFILSIAAWYLIEACLLPDAVRSYSEAEYLFALLMIAGCILAFLAGYHQSRGGAFDVAFLRLAHVDHPQLLWRVFLAAAAIGFLPMMVIAKGDILLILEDAFVPGSRWSSPFQRGRYGGLRDAFLELRMFLRAAIPLAAAVMVQRSQRSERRALAVAFLVFMFARAFNSGTRSAVVEVFLPIAAAIYWRLSAEWKRNAIRFGLPVLLSLAMIWSAASVVTRNSGDFSWERAADAEYVGFEMFRELLFLTRVVPEQADYKYGHTYYVQAVNPIPRFLWPGKPDGDAGLELSRLQGSTIDGRAYLTTSPGLIGEMYWNFGIPGVLLISALLGYLAKSWDRIQPLAHRSILAFTVFAAGLAIIFLSGRSFNMSTLYGMIALLAIIVFYSRHAVRRSPVARRPQQSVRSTAVSGRAAERRSGNR